MFGKEGAKSYKQANSRQGKKPRRMAREQRAKEQALKGTHRGGANQNTEAQTAVNRNRGGHSKKVGIKPPQ